VQAQVAQHGAVDVDLRLERGAEAGPPALRVPPARLVEEDVGLERGEALLAHLPPHGLDAVEVGDGGLVPGRMIDAPGGAVRPVHPEPVAHLAAEQLVAGHAEAPGLGVEQRVLDGAQRLADDAAGAGPGGAVKVGVDALVLAHRLADDPRRQPLDHRPDAGRAEPFRELAPTDDGAVGAELHELVVAPARIAGERLHARDLHAFSLGEEVSDPLGLTP
jgi:hypothetical protein